MPRNLSATGRLPGGLPVKGTQADRYTNVLACKVQIVFHGLFIRWSIFSKIPPGLAKPTTASSARPIIKLLRRKEVDEPEFSFCFKLIVIWYSLSNVDSTILNF